MDVTAEVLRNHRSYGGSDNTNPAYNASNRSLDYARTSNSMLNAQIENVTAIPRIINYKDSVGLFGAENIFVKVQLNIQNSKQIDDNGVLIDDYEDAVIQSKDSGIDIFWNEAENDTSADLTVVETYEPAQFVNELNFISGAVVKIDLENLKTGNKYIDAWFDVRLYQKNKEEHPYDVMYVPINDCFYIGFHARNTKRLPYNVRMTVNGELISKYNLTAQQRQYLVS